MTLGARDRGPDTDGLVPRTRGELGAVPVFAGISGKTEIPWATMAMTLFGGLAIFLFGMEQMADALKA